MKVYLHQLIDKQDVVTGVLTLSGGEIVASPDSYGNRRVLEMPIVERHVKGQTTRWLHADENPEEFLLNLQYAYQGSYFWATAPEEEKLEKFSETIEVPDNWQEVIQKAVKEALNG